MSTPTIWVYIADSGRKGNSQTPMAPGLRYSCGIPTRLERSHQLPRVPTVRPSRQSACRRARARCRRSHPVHRRPVARPGSPGRSEDRPTRWPGQPASQPCQRCVIQQPGHILWRHPCPHGHLIVARGAHPARPEVAARFRQCPALPGLLHSACAARRRSRRSRRRANPRPCISAYRAHQHQAGGAPGSAVDGTRAALTLPAQV